MISIHALREEGDQKPGKARPRLANFYPRPPRGGRPGRGQGKLEGRPFLSTPSARRATGAETPLPTRAGFLSTPSARRATPGQPAPTAGLSISIHALREEGDKGTLKSGAGARISIHALREEGDGVTREKPPPRGLFLSTPSARRATLSILLPCGLVLISIHALREEGDPGFAVSPALRHPISIHALREEGDSSTAYQRAVEDIFLSTPSARRATQTRETLNQTLEKFLSTPSARRATLVPLLWQLQRRYFYPRPPRGGRRALPLLPLALGVISIHALREEGDLLRLPLMALLRKFLSTPSARRATCCGGLIPSICTNFYPRPPRGGRHTANASWCCPSDFYPRPPRGGRPVL